MLQTDDIIKNANDYFQLLSNSNLPLYTWAYLKNFINSSIKKSLRRTNIGISWISNDIRISIDRIYICIYIKINFS